MSQIPGLSINLAIANNLSLSGQKVVGNGGNPAAVNINNDELREKANSNPHGVNINNDELRDSFETGAKSSFGVLMSSAVDAKATPATGPTLTLGQLLGGAGHPGPSNLPGSLQPDTPSAQPNTPGGLSAAADKQGNSTEGKGYTIVPSASGGGSVAVVPWGDEVIWEDTGSDDWQNDAPLPESKKKDQDEDKPPLPNFNERTAGPGAPRGAITPTIDVAGQGTVVTVLQAEQPSTGNAGGWSPVNPTADPLGTRETHGQIAPTGLPATPDATPAPPTVA
ncbi:MAG: hypothetical protein AB1714_09005 [Acidobacteriota bacterium]